MLREFGSHVMPPTLTSDPTVTLRKIHECQPWQDDTSVGQGLN